jgi:hypothetical protein
MPNKIKGVQQKMSRVTTKTETKAEARQRDVYLTLTGRSVYYDTPQTFVEEAQRLGISRKVAGLFAYPGDVIIFATAPHRLKREKGYTFNPYAFGFSVVKGYAIYPKTGLARKVLSAAIKSLVERGLAQVVITNEIVNRRCGYYHISSKVTISDWAEFDKTLHDLWLKELHNSPETTARKTLSHFDFLVQGDFKVIEPMLELPFEIKYTRTLRLVKPEELTLLYEALKERLGVAAVDAVFDERPDQPAILLELSEYVQQAISQPKADKAPRQRRRKKTEQPTHIPEPEPTPEPEAPKPLIETKPEHKTVRTCIRCGKVTEGAILCSECREQVLNKVKELRGAGYDNMTKWRLRLGGVPNAGKVRPQPTLISFRGCKP